MEAGTDNRVKRKNEVETGAQKKRVGKEKQKQGMQKRAHVPPPHRFLA